MDNPDLIVTCVVGDGEAETGPTATWVYPHFQPRASTDIIQGMARYQVSGPSGIRCCHPHPARQRIQDQRADHIWLHGRQGDHLSLQWLRLPGLHCGRSRQH
jgi:hypothetical protein